MNLGVLGDPNTGKSVLSRMLYHMFRRRYRRVWIYDSDQASGTPAWYLHMRSRERHDEANAYRNRTKRAWTPELEREAAGDIRTMRETLALVTVDLPGGRHPKAGETFAPQRVPPGREVILREIDAFVILARDDNQKSFEAWRADLANHGLDGRIIANWISQNPAASCFSLAPSSTPDRLVFEGLERSNLSPEKIAAVSDAVMDAVMEYPPLKKLLASVETVGDTAQ